MNELCVKLVNAFFYSKLELSDGVTIFAILDSGPNLIMAMSANDNPIVCIMQQHQQQKDNIDELSNDDWSANFFLDRFP